MTQLRFGLQARFLLVMALTLLLVGTILASLLQRQSAMQREVRGLSAQILHELFDRSLRTRGETLATELASGLANPVYYSDLGAVGALVRNAMRQQVVSYVLVFDRHGRLVHDGTPTLQRYGQAMTDPLAAKRWRRRKWCCSTRRRCWMSRCRSRSATSASAACGWACRASGCARSSPAPI